MMKIPWKVRNSWTKFWMRSASHKGVGRLSSRLATLFTAHYYDRIPLSRLNKNGFISPDATISHSGFRGGNHIFIDCRVLLFRSHAGGDIELGDRVRIMRDSIFQTGEGGSVKIGAQTFIQARCNFSAYHGDIVIGEKVQIAPNCSFYSYNHSFEKGKKIVDQPLFTKGGITIGEDAWLGVGVTVLDGVTIGAGSVIAAGAVVDKDVPAEHIAAGVPVKIIGKR